MGIGDRETETSLSHHERERHTHSLFRSSTSKRKFSILISCFFDKRRLGTGSATTVAVHFIYHICFLVYLPSRKDQSIIMTDNFDFDAVSTTIDVDLSATMSCSSFAV
jgi:hypothetical protein